VLNALYLQQLNYGRHATALDGQVLGAFLEALPDCARSLQGYAQEGNTVLLAKLDELLVEAASRKGAPWDEVTVQ
jgi:hypothetical protein